MEKTNATAAWLVLSASFSDATGGLSIRGENRNLSPNEPDYRFSWNIGVHSLRDDGWRRYDWSRTVWTDSKARATFERLAGVSAEDAGLA